MGLIADFEKTIGRFKLNIHLAAGDDSLSLLGASGCGKSMTLKCIAGIERPDKGRIELNGVTLFDSEQGIDLPPQERRVGYLFQEGALFPNMTILDNVVCGIREKMQKREKQRIAREMLTKMHLSDTCKRRPDSLSGGQRQRAALARILVGKPEILLLDEPFSALDSHLRFELERVVSDTMRELAKPAIFVSHNRDEAFRITDRIAIMKEGRIEIEGDRHHIFADPQTVYAARMTGCKNVASVVCGHGDGSFVSKSEDKKNVPMSALSDVCEDKRTVPVSPMTTVYVPDWGIELAVPHCDRPVSAIGIRMHDIILGPGEINEFTCKVEEEIENPFSYTVMLRPSDNKCLGVELDKPAWEAARAESVTIHIPPENVLLLRE